MREFRVMVTASLLALGVAGCRSGSPFQANGPTPSGAVTLDVRNDNFADMDVYVVSEGLASLVGTVNGMSKASFILDPTFFPSSDLRVVATPIGGNGRAASDRLIVPPGHTIDFTIGAVARESRAIVH